MEKWSFLRLSYYKYLARVLIVCVTGEVEPLVHNFTNLILRHGGLNQEQAPPSS